MDVADMPQQRQELKKPDLAIIGGKDCEAVTRTPGDGDSFKIGSIAVKALYTPCHTQDSICWFMQDGEQKVVFTGDTLFHSGECLPLPSVPSLPSRLTPSTQAAASSSRGPRRRCTRR